MGRNAQLRSATASLIGRYINGIRLRMPTAGNARLVEIAEALEREITLWKELTWIYVIENPALVTQQEGQRRVIRDLFNIYQEAAQAKKWNLFPGGFRESLEAASEANEALRRDGVDVVVILTAQ